MPVTYLDVLRISGAKIHEPDWMKQGLMQTATGYGRKLVTPYMVQLDGVSRWYRVYAICFSNASSHYVLVRGDRLFISDYDGETIREMCKP